MVLSRAIAGDHLGNVVITIGLLWAGPEASKFKGLDFIDANIKYSSDEIVQVVKLDPGQANSKSDAITSGIAGALVFGLVGAIAGASSGGKVQVDRFGIEFSNGKKVVIENTPNEKSLQCLLMWAEDKGIYKEKKQDLGF
jgi:hypothetical protein